MFKEPVKNKPSGNNPSMKRNKRKGSMTLEKPNQGEYITLGKPNQGEYMTIYEALPKNIYGAFPGAIPGKILNYPEEVHPFGKPATYTSPTKNSIYQYLTNKGTKSSNYSARLARINPEKLSQLSGDESLKYLKKNFTAVKADEINKFFGEELKDMTNPAEKQAKIKEILNQFTNQASRNNKAKNTVMSNLRTFTNSAAAQSRISRTKRSNNLAKSLSGQLSSARAALNTRPQRKPLRQLLAEKEGKPRTKRKNSTYSTLNLKKQPEHIYADLELVEKTPLVKAREDINKPPPLPPPRGSKTIEPNVYENMRNATTKGL